MRLVIDKDISEIQLLQEAYEKSRPSYTVMAVENGEKFVYGQKLTFNEARETIYDLAFDPLFGNEVDGKLFDVHESSVDGFCCPHGDGSGGSEPDVSLGFGEVGNGSQRGVDDDGFTVGFEGGEFNASASACLTSDGCGPVGNLVEVGG